MKERMSKRVFVDNVLLYVRDPIVSTPKLLNLTKTFMNVSEHKDKMLQSTFVKWSMPLAMLKHAWIAHLFGV